MIVPSPVFLGFAAVAAVLFNLSTVVQWRQLDLLAANVAFLTTFSSQPRAFLPFAGFLALGFAAQYFTRDGARKHLFIGLLVLMIGAFFG